MAGTVIREARGEDAVGVARVHVDAWRETYSDIVPRSFLDRMSYEGFESRWRGWLGESGRGRVFFVAEASEGVVGFASGGPRRDGPYPEYDGELYAVYLLREHQRGGIGRTLCGAVAEGLAAGGCRSMLLWVLSGNLPARRFYEVMGGRLLGSRTLEIGGEVLEEVAYGWDDIHRLTEAPA